MGIGGRIMYINIDFTLPENIQEQIKQAVIESASEQLVKNPEELRKMVRECVKGILMARINDILQTRDYRAFLRDKIAKEIGIESKD